MNPDLINLITSIVLFVFFCIFYFWYIKLSIDEAKIIINNYNLRKAKLCNPDNCGFYHHDETDPQSKDCLNPQVEKKFFDNLSRNGNQRGCRRSFQVREIDVERKPASEYKLEFLQVYNAFHPSKLLWRLIIILATSILFLLGVLTSSNFIQLLAK
jgi:hypothetical protein